MSYSEVQSGVSKLNTFNFDTGQTQRYRYVAPDGSVHFFQLSVIDGHSVAAIEFFSDPAYLCKVTKVEEFWLYGGESQSNWVPLYNDCCFLITFMGTYVLYSREAPICEIHGERRLKISAINARVTCL